ncbi:MAG: ATP-binding cassette domain-containing protein [Spirochaetales bacterium]|nr:ATP-binding cassette domain-containing protein [Spirochaetales bacterium]
MTGIILNKLTFGYSSPLIEDLTCSFSRGWTAITGKNGCGKTTLLKLIMGQLKPWSGTITTKGTIAYCSQSTELPAADAENFMWDYSGTAMRLKGLLQIKEDWLERWSTLSFGERVRFQTARALNAEPDILIVDEPTNHLDSESREMLYNSLKNFRGTGLLVSHDRKLLNELPFQCLFFKPPSAVMRPGTYLSGKAEESREYNELLNSKTQLQKNMKRLHTEAQREKRLAAKADSDKSKKNLGKKDSDGRAKLDLARLTGKDAVHGQLYKTMQNRILKEEEKIAGINIKKQKSVKLYSDTSSAKSDFLIRLSAGRLVMGARTLVYPDLFVSPLNKIGITGSNGCGKSSLVKYIVNSIRPDNCLYIPQEISEKDAASFTRKISQLPKTERGKVYASIDRLGSDPRRLLETESPSPGELRKLILAEGFLNSPSLLIMDEPTNHMDLDSVECLEEALKEAECAIMLVSHDRYFMDSIIKTEWKIEADESEDFFKLEIRK